MLKTLTITVGQNEQPLEIGQVVEFRKNINERYTYVVKWINPVPLHGHWTVTMERLDIRLNCE